MRPGPTPLRRAWPKRQASSISRRIRALWVPTNREDNAVVGTVHAATASTGAENRVYKFDVATYTLDDMLRPKRISRIQRFGLDIIRRAIEQPLRTIASNGDLDPSIAVATVLDNTGSFGLNANTGDYCDMIEAGIVDPTKVTRTALQNAASVSGLLLTTEAMIAEAVEEKDEHAH